MSAAVIPLTIWDMVNLLCLGISFSTHIHLLIDVLPRASFRHLTRPVNILVWSCAMGFLVAANNSAGYLYGHGTCAYHFGSVWLYSSQKYGFSLFLVHKANYVLPSLVDARARRAFTWIMGVLWVACFVSYQLNSFYFFQPFVDDTGLCVIAFREGYGFTIPYFIDAVICVVASATFTMTLRGLEQPVSGSERNAVSERVAELRRRSIYAAFVSVGFALALIVYFLGFQVPEANLSVFLIEEVAVNCCMVYSNRLLQASGSDVSVRSKPTRQQELEAATSFAPAPARDVPTLCAPASYSAQIPPTTTTLSNQVSSVHHSGSCIMPNEKPHHHTPAY